MKTVILARVSTREQEEGFSTDAQMQRLREHAQLKNLCIIKEFSLTESASKDKRENFERILDFVTSQNEPIAILVDTVDRITRNFKDAVKLDDLRKAGKVEIHFYRENLVVTKDSNSAEILRWDMAIMFAKSYVLQLSDNVKRSQEQKLRNGEWPGPAPIGYKNVKNEAGKSDIIADERYVDLIKKSFELYATGNYSLSTLRAQLNSLGLTSNINLSQGFMDKILKDSFYYGEMNWKGKKYPHKYLKIITKELFDSVQLIKTNWHKKPFKYASKPFIFRGLIQCSQCGCTITAEKSKDKYIYYHCTNYHKTHTKEDLFWIREEKLIEQVSNNLKQLLMPEDVLQDLTEALKRSHEDESSFYKRNITLLEQELARIKSRLEQMYEDKLDGRITNDIYDKKAKEYLNKRDQIMGQINNHTRADSNYYIEAKKVLDISQRAFKVFESSEPEEKRQFLNYLLQNCTLNGRNLDVSLRKPFDELLVYTKEGNWLGDMDSNHD